MRRAFVVLLAAFAACLCQAKVITLDLQALTKQSSLVLIGTVGAIKQDGFRIAEIRVERTLKGRAPSTVEVISEPTWACDISKASPGERLLVFLNAVKPGKPLGSLIGRKVTFNRPVYAFGHAGRGRIQLLSSGARSFISFKPLSWMERTEYVINLLLPKNLPYRKDSTGATVLPAELLIAKVDSYLSKAS